MSADFVTGTVELPVADIRVEDRHRKDLGDIRELAESIDTLGLIHPPVLTPDFRLVAGERRLAAVKSLGWDTVPVTIIHTLADVTDQLQAECDENTCRKDFTPTEAASVRRAVADALAPVVEQERREAISDHGGRAAASKKDSSKLEPSLPRPKTRNVAAKGTGFSATTLDKVDKVVEVAESPATPEPVKVAAKEAIAEMDATGNVSKAHQKVTEAQLVHAAVEEFPDLAYYAESGRNADVIRLSGALRGYQEPERSIRVDALQRSITAERDGRLNQPPPDGPDYAALANKMFIAANNAAQVIEKSGGAETIAEAVACTDQLGIALWREQFDALAATCAALAHACSPKLKVIR